MLYTVSQKQDHLWLTASLKYMNNSDNFWQNVTEEVSNQNVLYFSCHQVIVFALPRKTGNPKIVSFHLNMVHAALPTNPQNTFKLSLVTDE